MLARIALGALVVLALASAAGAVLSTGSLADGALAGLLAAAAAGLLVGGCAAVVLAAARLLRRVAARLHP